MSLNRGRPPGESYNPITESVLTGLYANTWFDGFGGFALPPIAKSPIAKHAGQILLTLGLLPTAIILLGVWTACVRLRREGRDDTIVFMLVGFAAMWVVFVYGTLSVPTHAAIKATYFMPISVIFAFWFAMGLDRLARIDRAHLNRVAVVCGVLGVTSCVVFAHGLIVGHRWFDDIRRGGAYQNLYGIVHYAGGETSKARAHFETAAARGDAYAHENLAAFAFAEDDLTEALYRSRGAIQIYKSSKRIRNAANNRHFQVGHAEQLNTVAVIYARLGWIREAVMSARRALNLDMPVPEVSFNLGVLRLMQVLEMSDQNRQERMKLLARSDELFEESRELDPAFHQAVAMRGVVAAMRGRCRLAAERIHESEMLAENSRRLYPFETGPGDIHAAALIRRRRIDPLPSRLQPETALDECRRRAG